MPQTAQITAQAARTHRFLKAIGISAAVFGASALFITLPGQAQTRLKVGVVYDSGGKFDRSFNQRVFEGLERAKKQLGVTVVEFEPDTPADIEKGMRQLANQRLDVVIGVGFASEAATTNAAKDFPGVKFVVLDAVPKGNNTKGLVFSEHEGSYLVGFIAGRTTASGVVGFVGGMDIPLIHKFELGFAAGVKRACPSCTVLAEYIGNTPAAFNDAAKGKEITARFVGRGADVVYAAAGASGNGVQDYVKAVSCLQGNKLPQGVKFRNNALSNIKKPSGYDQKCGTNSRPLFFIGVDSNQNRFGDTDKTPTTLNHGLTSMEKRLDNAIFALLKDMSAGKNWVSGPLAFGLKEFGVGYAVDEFNKALLPASLIQDVAQIKDDIVKGSIKVPDKK
jgi:basic membrane protein A and related proteins